MITQQHRPKTFKEVAGQKLVVDTLKCIAKSPENAPRTIILQGEFGTGKTTTSRILARALNCPNQVNGEPCGDCPVCNADLDLCSFYEEYDSAVVGGVDQIRALRETFYFNSNTGYRVVVLDECHLISKQAQAALLKVFEETKGRIFFVLCTTDAQDLLPTIRSRSLELRFNLIPDIYLKENLKDIAVKEGIDIDDETLDLIVSRSGGHARNAHMLLDRYVLLGDTFKESVKSSKDDFIKIMVCGLLYKTTQDEASREKIKQAVTDTIYKLQCESLSSLKTDYEEVILDIFKIISKVKEAYNPSIANIASTISRGNMFDYFNFLTCESILSSFKSDKMFQAAMWLLFMNI